VHLLEQPLERLPDPLPIPSAGGPFDVAIRPPGSKSITNRLYVLAALSRGRSRIHGPLRSDDCDRLLAALETLGAGVAWEDDDVVIEGVDGRFPRGGAVDLGDGGTPTRFMIAAACLAAAPVTVDGSPRMRERPVAEGVELLRSLGARIEYVDAPERLPVRVEPAPLRGGVITVGPTKSSQFLSALMLIATWLPEGLTIELAAPPTSGSYVELTRRTLTAWGIPAEGDAARLHVPPRSPAGRDLHTEPDASSALYWIGAAALVPGASVRLAGLPIDSPQPDLALLEPLAAAGLRIGVRGAEGSLCAEGGDGLDGFAVDASGAPDGAMLLAAIAARARGPSRLRGLHTLRHKESDRITAMASELRRVGCVVDATDDELAIRPAPPAGPPAVVQTYDDHRVAMSFAVLGLVRSGISIADPACVRKSYPGFWRDLARLYAGGASRDT
jgi:3-phosphoshikimate 1-carboxyvinyltransferase